MTRTIHMLSAVVESRISGFLSGVERAKTATRDLRMSVGDFVNSVNSAGTRIAAGLTAATAGVTKMAFDFQHAMIPVRGVLAEMSDKDFVKFQRGLRDLSVSMGRSVTMVAEGANNLLQSGADATQTLETMRQIAPLVVAGQAEMSDATRLAANFVSAFKLEWQDTGKVMDTVFKANDDGIGSIKQWAAQLPTITSMAAKLNITFQEMLGQFASVSKDAKSAENAAVQLRDLYASIVRQDPVLDTIFQKAGHRNAEAAIKTIGFAKALNILVNASGGSLSELKKLLGSIEGVQAAIALTGKNAERTAEFTRRATDSMGVSTKRMDLAQREPVERFRRSWQAILDTVLTVGAAVGEEVTKLSEGFRKLTDDSQGEIVDQVVTGLKQFVQVGQSLVQFFTENKAVIKEAADEVGYWLGWLLKFATENPRIVGALVSLKVAGFLGLTGVVKSFFALLGTVGMSSLRAFLWGLGKLRVESKTTAESVAADAAKQATAREAASAKTIGALLAERNAQIAAQSASVGSTATVVGSAAVAAGAGATAASAASAGALHRQLSTLAAIALAVDTAVKRLSTTVMILTGSTRAATAGLLGFNRQLLLTGTVANVATESVRRIGTTAFTFGTVQRGAEAATGSMRRLTLQTVATGTAATVAGGKWASFFSILTTRVESFRSRLASLGPMASKGGVIALIGLAFVSVTAEITNAKKAAEDLERSIGKVSRIAELGRKQREENLQDVTSDEDKVSKLEQQLELLRAQERGATSNAAAERRERELEEGTHESQGVGDLIASKIRGIFSWGMSPSGAMARTADESERRAEGLRDEITEKEKELAKLRNQVAEKTGEATRQKIIADLQQAVGIDEEGAIDAGSLNDQSRAVSGMFSPNRFRQAFVDNMAGRAVEKEKGSAEADTQLTLQKREAFDASHPGADKLRELLMLASEKNVTVDQVKEFASTLKLTDAATFALTNRFQELKDANDVTATSMGKLTEEVFLLDEAGKKADEKAKADFEKQQQAKKEQEEAARDIGDFFKDIRQRAVSSVEDLPDNAAAAGLRDKAEFFVEDFQSKAYVLEQSLANGSMSVDQFNRSMTDLRNEADASAAALQREIDAEKRRRLLRGDFSLLDPRKALEDRIISFRMQQFNQGIDSMFRRMFPFADQLGKTTDNFINLNNGIQNFGNTLQNFGTIGAEKVSESWNQITSWMNSRAGQIASVEAQIQLLLQNLSMMGGNSFNYRGMQLRKQLDSLYDILDALMAQAPPTFVDTSGSGLFHDPGLQTTQQQQTNNISLSFPNLDKLTNADARQILQVVNLELQRAGHQRVF